jgi:hypothetical protein
MEQLCSRSEFFQVVVSVRDFFVEEASWDFDFFGIFAPAEMVSNGRFVNGETFKPLDNAHKKDQDQEISAQWCSKQNSEEAQSSNAKRSS